MTVKDHSTFSTKTQRDHEDDLRSKYGELGNPDLVAALKQRSKSGPIDRSQQMQMSIAAREQD